MKTVAYWKSEWMHADDLDDLIAEIQSDALRHAADTVYGNRLLHGDGAAAQKSIAAIIEEAEKLESK